MSDNDNNTIKTQPLKTQPLKKTSAVPLRKETVRVTLKAAPGGVQDGPPAPSASVPAPAPAPAPSGPATAPAPAPKAMSPDPVQEPAAPSFPTGEEKQKEVDLPDVTSAVRLKAETMRVTLKSDGASTGPVTGPITAPMTAPLSNVAAPAPTIPLGSPTPLVTQPLGQTGGSSQPLPKATVQLNPTQPLTQPGVGGQAAAIHAYKEDIDAQKQENLHGWLAVVGFVAVLVFCGIQAAQLNDWATLWGDAPENSAVDALFE